MKKVLIILGIVFALLVVAVVTIPIIFKDDIQQALDEAMDENLNAKVFYDTDQFTLSLISNFPDFTVGLGDFGIVGIEQFAEDTLVSVGKFQITVDIMSAISGDQIKIVEVLLEEPKITVLVFPDGTANYDIAKPTTEEEVTESAEEPIDERDAAAQGDISIGVEKWAITNGQLIYLDQSMNLTATILGLNHEGSGDFTLDVFDMQTVTSIASVSLAFEGEEFIANKTFEADLNLNMDLAQMKFKFLENRIAVNNFAMVADGFVNMPGEDIEMDITFGGNNIDLKSILSLIPGSYQEYLDGVTASGTIGFDGYVKGIFNETSMPQVAANLSVENGGISYAEYPIPIEDLDIQTSFNYPSADLSQTSFNIDKFHMLVDGEEFSSYLKFKNLDNFNWDFGFDGNADLEKITKIIPLEGIELKGKINAKLNSAGQMSDVEAERYDQLPTSGSMDISNFLFISEDLPQGFGISTATLSFNPAEINLSEFTATLGNSDLSLTGKVTNYLAFALSENETIVGNLNFNSDLLDLNEWIPEEETEVVEDTAATEPLEVVKIPETIDFTLQANIKKIAVSDLSMENFKGRVLVKDGAIVLEENNFNMLDGTFGLTGSYQTKDLDQPKYDFAFDIKELSIANAFNAFETIQTYVPIAKQVSGKFSTTFTVDGTLGEDMMPLMDEMNLSGLVNIAEAALEKGNFMNKLSAVTSFKGGTSSGSAKENITLKDVLVSAAIKNGRLFIEPFDLSVGGQKATLGGSNSLDGKLDYAMQLKDIPTGAIGSALSGALGSLTGGKKLISDKINLNLGIVGTTDNPKVNLLGSSPSGESTSAKAAFQNQVNAKVEAEKAKAEAELAKKKAAAEAKAKAAADSAKAALEAKKKEAEAKKKAAEEAAKKKIEEEKKKAEEAAKNKLKGLLKKKGGGD
ncbi:MAG: AsmA-like C-terminal region-containing protein [Cyclobacteriaceae bacterium]